MGGNQGYLGIFLHGKYYLYLMCCRDETCFIKEFGNSIIKEFKDILQHCQNNNVSICDYFEEKFENITLIDENNPVPSQEDINKLGKNNPYLSIMNREIQWRDLLRSKLSVWLEYIYKNEFYIEENDVYSLDEVKSKWISNMILINTSTEEVEIVYNDSYEPSMEIISLPFNNLPENLHDDLYPDEI